MSSWEEEESQGRFTRREWVRFGLALGTVGALGGLGGLVTGQLLPPPIRFNGEVSQTIRYTRFPTPQWWNIKDGLPVKPGDFTLWEGATAVWQGLYQSGTLIPGTGYPVIVIRIPANAPEFTAPTTADLVSSGVTPPPSGFDLYFEDLTMDAANGGTRIVVLFDRCVHLCCYPGWHVIPVSDRTYLGPTPTYYVYKQDPVYCICHGSQYDPLLLKIAFNPVNNVNYVGATHVHGPAARELAVIPVQLKSGTLVGGLPDPLWYEYC